MSKCAGNIPEFDDLDDGEELERGRRLHRPRRCRKRKQAVRAIRRVSVPVSRACC